MHGLIKRLINIYFFLLEPKVLRCRKCRGYFQENSFYLTYRLENMSNFPKIWTVFKMNYTLFCYKNIFYKYIEADIKEIFRILTSYYNRARGPYRGILARGRGSSDRPRANNPQYGSS